MPNPFRSNSISGSIYRTVEGHDYLRAGTNVTIDSGTLASTGQIVISSAGGGGSGGGADPEATYIVLNTTSSLANERVLTGSTGIIVTDNGAGNSVNLSINDSIVATVSGTKFSGSIEVTGSVGVSSIISIGSAPATTGEIRFEHGASINARTSAGTESVAFIGYGNLVSNAVELGSTNPAAGSSYVYSPSGGTANLAPGGTSRLSASTSLISINGLPLRWTTGGVTIQNSSTSVFQDNGAVTTIGALNRNIVFSGAGGNHVTGTLSVLNGITSSAGAKFGPSPSDTGTVSIEGDVRVKGTALNVKALSTSGNNLVIGSSNSSDISSMNFGVPNGGSYSFGVGASTSWTFGATTLSAGTAAFQILFVGSATNQLIGAAPTSGTPQDLSIRAAGKVVGTGSGADLLLQAGQGNGGDPGGEVRIQYNPDNTNFVDRIVVGETQVEVTGALQSTDMIAYGGTNASNQGIPQRIQTVEATTGSDAGTTNVLTIAMLASSTLDIATDVHAYHDHLGNSFIARNYASFYRNGSSDIQMIGTEDDTSTKTVGQTSGWSTTLTSSAGNVLLTITTDINNVTSSVSAQYSMKAWA